MVTSKNYLIANDIINNELLSFDSLTDEKAKGIFGGTSFQNHEQPQTK